MKGEGKRIELYTATVLCLLSLQYLDIRKRHNCCKFNGRLFRTEYQNTGPLTFQQKAPIHLQQDRLNMFQNNTRPICLL